MIAKASFSGERGNWMLAGWTALVVAFVGDAGPPERAIALVLSAIALGTFVLLARPVPARSAVLAVTGLALVAPSIVWLAQSTVGAFVPLERPILATCCNLVLAMVAGVLARPTAWSSGLALATCVVAALYVDERLCVPIYVGTMLAGCAAFASAGGGGGGAPLASRVVVYGTIMATCCAAAWMIDDERHVGGRGGFVPTSGGRGEGSVHATMGVGDGPDVVNATRDGARTIGFDQSDVFVNSEHAGLYDAFVETFGEPARASEVKKMIGLKRDQIITSPQQAALDLRRGKTFSILRSPPLPSAYAGGAAADAVMWVDSDRSQHIPLRAYDHFDGIAWRPALQSDVKASLHNVDEPHWMVRVDRPFSAAIGEPVTTTIVTGRFDESVVPMPALSTAFRLGRVDRTDFFRAAQPSFVRLRDRAVPAGTSVEVRHCLLRPDWSTRSTPGHRAMRTSSLSDEPDPLVDAFVRRAAQGRAAGWPQVESLLAAVRSSARFDDAAVISSGEAPLDAFLARGVGASYDFASVYALGLDRLGYDARVVAGFYADAHVRDPRSGQIVVRPTDAHFWCELRLADGTWIPIDPTPGFDVAVERPGSLALASAAMRALFARHAVITSLGAVAFSVAAICWRRLVSLGVTLVWRARLLIGRGGHFAQTAAMLDRRARLAGVGRRASQTFAQWLADRAVVAAHPTAIASFREELDRELYGVKRGPKSARYEIPFAVARELSFAALRRARRLDLGVE